MEKKQTRVATKGREPGKQFGNILEREKVKVIKYRKK